MNKKTTSLRTQFLTRLFGILLIIVLLSGGIQIFFIKEQINDNVTNQADMLIQSIEQGIQSTDLASKSIEHQIDLKLISYARHIGDLLGEKEWTQITDEQLSNILDRFQLDGITIFARQDDDIVGVKATDPKEIGFSFKKIGFIDGYYAMDNRLKGETIGIPVSYESDDAHVLPIVQSGSHGDTPTFFKYAYYVAPNKDYIINPYVEANEVYQFTKEVGPDSWIAQVNQENPYVEEIAVVNPKVFKDPSLETEMFPPMPKILHGTFDFENSKNIEVLKAMVDYPKEMHRIQRHGGKKIYEMFIPVDENRVIYAALDYGKISDPLYRHSVILILSGIISLVALFILAARFFNRIYENIQHIKKQIISLEDGDFTAKSKVNDGSELSVLSESANRMVETLHDVLSETRDQASKVQRLSLILENDANQSVEKMYTLSMETTMKQREIVDEIIDFLDQIENHIQSADPTNQGQKILLNLEKMREVAKDRASVTTDMTLTLSDLLSSLHGQSKELTDISKNLLQRIQKFIL